MSFLRRKRLFIFLISFIILVALIGYSISERQEASTLEKFFNDTVGWIQSAVHVPVSFITGIAGNVSDLITTYEENKILREQLSQYKGLIYEVQELRKENEELRKAIGETDSIRDYEPIHATVISRSPEQWIDEVTINKGEHHGVEANMVVITADGMVGKIRTAYEFTSKVQLLTGFDQYNRISATISKDGKNNIYGMIEGYDKESKSLVFRIIEESEKDVKEGDLVVSSGLGGVFPAGLVIGEVKEVGFDQYGLTRTALVEPAADVYEINHVIVVDRSLEEREEEVEEQQ